MASAGTALFSSGEYGGERDARQPGASAILREHQEQALIPTALVIDSSWPGLSHRCPARFMLHAAFSKVTQARSARRRCAARVAEGSKSNLACCGSGAGGGTA